MPTIPIETPVATPPECPPMGIDTTPEEWAAAHQSLMRRPGHHVEVTAWGAICACGALWSRDPTRGGEARNRPMPVASVAIGDTFERVNFAGGPWEVVEAVGDGWRVRRRASSLTVRSSALLDPARWRRVRAL